MNDYDRPWWRDVVWYLSVTAWLTSMALVIIVILGLLGTPMEGTQ